MKRNAPETCWRGKHIGPRAPPFDPSVRVSADAPSKVSAESVFYSITDGTNQHDGEVTGDTDVSVTIPTQNPGPWSATLVYRRDGCADRIVGPVSRTLDFKPPGSVTGLSATTETYGATLTWTNPTDADFVGVRIAMKLGSPLTRFDDPEAVELCNQSVCKGTSYHVLGVPAGEVYFAVFATDDLLPGCRCSRMEPPHRVPSEDIQREAPA